MTKQEIITALRAMIDGERYPREDCDKCQLHPAMGERQHCVDCINNVLRNAAWLLEKEAQNADDG